MIDRITRELSGLQRTCPVGRIVAVTGGRVTVSGLGKRVQLGDRATIGLSASGPSAEVVRIGDDRVDLLPEGACEGLHLGQPVRISSPRHFAPGESWIGRVVDPDGVPLDGRPLLPGPGQRALQALPPAAHDRRPFGPRLATGYAVFDTLLPVVRGQRLGLFAGSGVGKSSLLAGLARGVEADVIVIGLVGERGRELRHFVESVLGPEGMARTVLVVATSDRAPQVRRRCAWAATAVAEHFRDTGRQVLLLIDSLTRFAEAHRELAVHAGEPAALRGFPATTGAAIAALCERAGPGVAGSGDITAIYTVLVAGSDMDEPVADMVRGVLDGHVVLDRSVAERGRFPAIDILRSVSRSLPDAASEGENVLIAQARSLMGIHDKTALMVRAGLYSQGSDAMIDAAIACEAELDRFVTLTSMSDCDASFAALRTALAPARQILRPVHKGGKTS
ncbi:MAG: FliI/YscN family ATPase [Rubellimicrobium sp.]|nr:FliI/YscN family ATPase [Rubellimicrobium sp.]